MPLTCDVSVTMPRELTIKIAVNVTVLLLYVVFILLFKLGVMPTTIQSFNTEDPAIDHQLLPETVSGYVIVVLTIVIPSICIAVQNLPIRRNPFPYIAILHGNFATLLLTFAVKHFAGELRPNFLALCQVNESLFDGEGYVNESMSAVVCTGADAVDGRHSFPSSHSSQAFYGMILSILIVNAYDWPTHMLVLKASIQFCFLTFATWVAISRIVDYHHHWWDALAGSILGAGIAYFEHEWCLKKIYEEFKEDGTENKQDAHTTKAWSASQRQAPTARRSFQIQSVV